MKPWEYIWLGLVIAVVGGVLSGLLGLGGAGLGFFGAALAGIGVIAEGVRIGNHESRAPQWAPPQQQD